MKKKLITLVLLAGIIVLGMLILDSMLDFDLVIDNRPADDDTNVDDDSNEIIKPDNSNEVPDGNLIVTIIDVGQGDSILLEIPGGDKILVDTGPRTSSEKLIEFLQEKNALHLDYLILTHPHEDHIGTTDLLIENGLIVDNYLVSKYPCDTLTCERVNSSLEKSFAKKIEFNTGDILETEIPVTILSPSIENYALDGANNSSVVLLVQHKNVRFLLTGDCEIECEELIIEENPGLWANVLKAGHHGSKTSSSQEFLNLINPKTVVISVGEKNQYGHPHNITLDKIAESGAVIYRTDLFGDIKITSDGELYTTLTDRSGFSITLGENA